MLPADAEEASRAAGRCRGRRRVGGRAVRAWLRGRETAPAVAVATTATIIGGERLVFASLVVNAGGHFARRSTAIATAR